MRPHVQSPPDMTILQELHRQWVQIVWRASTDMLVSLKKYHRRCEQHLERYIVRERKQGGSNTRAVEGEGRFRKDYGKIHQVQMKTGGETTKKVTFTTNFALRTK